MTKEKMIIKYVEDYILDWGENYGAKAKRSERSLKWIIDNSSLSVSRVLESISYEELKKGTEYEIDKTLYVKIGAGFCQPYVNYIVVPKYILKLSVQKKLFPEEAVVIDSSKIIIK